MSADLHCPCCGAELDLATAFAAESDRQALARLVSMSVPLGARVLQYLSLHQPAKQRLTAAKKIKLLLQLLPDLERRAITHKGRDWQAPLPAWAAAMDQMLAQRDTGRLELPLKGHGYLYAVLAASADKHEAQAEQQREQERINAARPRAHGQAQGIAAALGAAPPPGLQAGAVPAVIAPRTTPQASPGQSPTVRRMKEAIERRQKGLMP